MPQTEHNWNGSTYHSNSSPQLAASIKYLEAYPHIFPGKKIKVLDLGCGSGLIAQHLLKKYPNIEHYVGIEKSQSMLDKANAALSHERRFSSFSMDIQDEDLYQKIGEKNFDVIISFWTLHWVPNLHSVAQSIVNLLNEKGHFLCLNRLAGSTQSQVLKEVSQSEGWKKHFESFKTSYCQHNYAAVFNQLGLELQYQQNDMTQKKYFESDDAYLNYIRLISDRTQHLHPALQESFLSDVIHAFKRKLKLNAKDKIYTEVPIVHITCSKAPKNQLQLTRPNLFLYHWLSTHHASKPTLLGASLAGIILLLSNKKSNHAEGLLMFGCTSLFTTTAFRFFRERPHDDAVAHQTTDTKINTP